MTTMTEDLNDTSTTTLGKRLLNRLTFGRLAASLRRARFPVARDPHNETRHVGLDSWVLRLSGHALTHQGHVGPEYIVPPGEPLGITYARCALEIATYAQKLPHRQSPVDRRDIAAAIRILRRLSRRWHQRHSSKAPSHE